MDNRVPLAERMRPQTLDEVVGQDEIIGDGKILTEIVRKQEPEDKHFVTVTYQDLVDFILEPYLNRDGLDARRVVRQSVAKWR